MLPPPILILTGPSGAGKSSILDLLVKQKPFPFRKFVTSTTRPKRPGERHGKDYWFMTEKEFVTREAQGDFFESATVYGNHYGSLRETMEELLTKRLPILITLDVQGMKTVKRLYANAYVIFIDAPQASLIHRLEKRSTDPKELKKRNQKIAIEEKAKQFADIIIENKDGKLPQTLASVTRHIQAYLKKRQNSAQ
jgi:guanylate kinase